MQHALPHEPSMPRKRVARASVLGVARMLATSSYRTATWSVLRRIDRGPAPEDGS